MNKESIKAILDNECQLPEGADLDDVTGQLAASLGSTDAYVRENSMEILWTWGTAGRYDDDQLIWLGQQMAANLSIGLGESGTDTVFLRAFSALVLAMVVIVDQRCELGQIEGREPFLSEEQVLAWFRAAVACLAAEKDLRGFAGEPGWAHSIAHVSDALGDFARSRHLGIQNLEQLLQAVATKMIEPTDVIYCFGEESRLARTVRDVLLRDCISMSFLTSWLDTLAHAPDGGNWPSVLGLYECDIQGNNARMNARGFLRSLYFQIAIDPRNSRADDFPEFYERPLPNRDELMSAIINAIRTMHMWGDTQD